VSDASHLHRQLLDQAHQLAIKEPKKPKQGSLRRAVSSAYYSLFHFLIHEGTKAFIGTGHGQLPLRNVLSRAFSHGTMGSASKAFEGRTLPVGLGSTMGTALIAAELRSLAATFVELQHWRHVADYDLSARFFRQEVLALITRVGAAMNRWDVAGRDPMARLYLVSLLTWDRLHGRR
jgi:hypothetical protein